jgi:dTDP-4-dehydrorhamnose reductase
MSTRLLVTGGTGYLGRVVAARAAADGWDVVAVGSADADVRDRHAVESLLQAVAPDVVVHTAYVRDGPMARSVIVDGTAHVANAAHAVGARLVHVSTDVVFDGRAGRPYRESDPASPITPYGQAKAASEHLATTLAPGALVVRTSLIYGGPGGAISPHEAAVEDPGATFYEDELRCPVQVDDLAGALLELAVADTSGLLHVAGADGVSRREFAELVAGRRVRGGPAPAGRPLDCRLDTSLAARLLRTPLRGVRQVYAR